MADLSLYILTFNCGRTLIDVDAVASQLFSGLETSTLPDLLVISLQEIAPVAHSLIGGSFLAPYFGRFEDAVEQAAQKISGTGKDRKAYTPIAVRNLGMTSIMIFGKDMTDVKDIETAGVGFGLWEMGNKGAVGVRFKYEAEGSATELTFVAVHLEAMEDAIDVRNANWKSIVRGLVFSSKEPEKNLKVASLSSEERPLLSISPRNATIYKATSHLFVAGDLNYRTSTLRPGPDDHKQTFPQPHHDPSSPMHYSNLFESDQLNQERLAGRTLHGLIEAPVTFPPTYKYDLKEPFLTPDEDLSRWHWAKHRWPSWCDRILFLDYPYWQKKSGNSIVTRKYSALPLFPTSDHRAVSLDLTVPLIPILEPEDEQGDDPRINPPFEIDVDWKSRRDRARVLELIVGFLAYFTTTWEGSATAVSLSAGVIGASFALRAMLQG